MRKAQSVHPAGSWSADAVTVTLGFDDRHRRRVVLRDDAGAEFLLDLERAAVLSDGDGLLCDDGSWIRVRAGDEEVADASASTLEQVARLAWHIGNRHIPVQVLANGTLRIRHDHVLEEMLEGLGAKVVRRRAPFAPEPGAYAARGGHHHHDH